MEEEKGATEEGAKEEEARRRIHSEKGNGTEQGSRQCWSGRVYKEGYWNGAWKVMEGLQCGLTAKGGTVVFTESTTADIVFPKLPEPAELNCLLFFLIEFIQNYLLKILSNSTKLS